MRSSLLPSIQSLNGRSECPQKYKDSTIGAYIRRALIHCSAWKQVHEEIERSPQVLVNNSFNENDIHRLTKKIPDSWYYSKKEHEKKEEIEIFYKAAFSTAYIEDERIMRQIVKKMSNPGSFQRLLSEGLASNGLPDVKLPPLPKPEAIRGIMGLEDHMGSLPAGPIPGISTQVTQQLVTSWRRGEQESRLDHTLGPPSRSTPVYHRGVYCRLLCTMSILVTVLYLVQELMSIMLMIFPRLYSTQVAPTGC
ncbi:hypothetical protein E2C01_083146 [Portunus trituberculatus]|uniref:Helix-turn-helix domain-containing protein n=1 Tax=Portunus trituberculatus TaxID=210409 RepID=A0A5B7J2N9_PORTR|nr:hypothetical protein [Portunus trituberculatus]